jgi:hypothetical protein
MWNMPLAATGNDNTEQAAARLVTEIIIASAYGVQWADVRLIFEAIRTLYPGYRGQHRKSSSTI